MVTSDARHWRRLIIDHNPFYILSGALMLLGCYLLGLDKHGQPDGIMPLVWLIVVLLVYQAATLVLGLWLSRSPTPETRRDTMQLLIVWLVLALDAAMLYHELFVRSAQAGAAMAAVGCVGALAGLATIGRVLRLRLSPMAWTLIALDVVLVFVVPAWYRHLAPTGFLPELTEFRAAWLLGIWIGLHALAPDFSSRALRWPVLQWTVLLLPCASVIAHVYVANWTYSRDGHEAFAMHHLVPLLLGAAAVVSRSGRGIWEDRCRVAATLMACIALFMSIVAVPYRFSLYWPWMDEMIIMIPGLAMTGLAALLLWLWLQRHGFLTFICGYLAGALAFAMHMPPMIGRGLNHAFQWLRRMMPDESPDWGIVAIVLAFVTLAVGAAVSLWLGRNDPAAGLGDARAMEHREIR